MKVTANATIVHGVLMHAEPASDGFGGDVAIEVADNVSPDAAADFIRPAAGTTLEAFYGAFDAKTTAALVGHRVRVELTYNAGPDGGRTVVRTLAPE